MGHRLASRTLSFTLAAALALAGGCGGGGGGASGPPADPRQGRASLKVGVLLPLSGWEDAGWRPLLTWAAEEVNAAGSVAGGSIELEFVDTASADLAQAAERLASDDRVLAVIGPASSQELEAVAPHFLRRKKLLVSPSATSEDIFKSYGGEKYVWRTVEADTAQLEAMISLAQAGGARTAALVAGADVYGQTFFNWFGFLAAEAGLEPVGTERYRAETAACEPLVEAATAAAPDVLFATVLRPEAVACIQRHTRLVSPGTRVLFSDGGFLPAAVDLLGADAEGMEGVIPVADPDGGFDDAYRARFGAQPTPFAANAWDALLLVAYGLARSGGAGGEPLADALIEVVDARGAPAGWDREGIAGALAAIRSGALPDVSGASGPLDYDAEFHTDPTATCFGHWRVEGGAYVTQAVFTTGQTRSAGTGAVRQPGSAELRTVFPDAQPGPSAERTDLWALVVAGSSGWSNYRHQADALAQYGLLRANGVPDDRIILVLADDLATDPRNPYPGQVEYRPRGENLYGAVEVDYRLDQVNAADLMDILAGNASERLDRVIGASGGHNVYVFLAGHGSRDGFFVGSDDALAVGGGSLLRPADLNATLVGMAAGNRYRQVLLAVESCHSGALGEALTAPNALMLTAASPYENSLAHNRRVEDGTWLADRFAFELWRAASEDPSRSLVALYEWVYERVSGSHVSVYNEENFEGEATVDVASFLSYR